MQNLQLNLSPKCFALIVAGLGIVEWNHSIMHVRRLLGISKSQFNSKWNGKENQAIFKILGITKQEKKKGAREVVIKFQKNEFYEETLEQLCIQNGIKFVELIKLCQRISKGEFYKEID